MTIAASLPSRFNRSIVCLASLALLIGTAPAAHSEIQDLRSPVQPLVRSAMLNIGFAHDPGVGNYDGAIGNPNDLWNFVSTGTTAMDFLRYSDTSPSPIRLRVTQHDGSWGITGHNGIFRGYIYDNCRCKDLKVTLLDMPQGQYRIFVYAHGDAPNQNANIELKVNGKHIGRKATANDESYDYRSRELTEGNQYVTFDFGVRKGDKVKVISRRDGSSYSMFNAIQIVAMSGAPTPSTTASKK